MEKVTKEEAKQKIKNLIQNFKEHLDEYKSNAYKEVRVREEYINPFFEALGWDVRNTQKLSEKYKDVLNEDSIRINGQSKSPDYSFRLGGHRVFLVEAKKPSVNIKEDIEPSYQTRRYGWNCKVPICILTDFEEFAIYDTTKKPNIHDKSSIARVKYIYFLDYEKEFDFFWELFSKDSILKGGFDKYLSNHDKKRGTSEIDSEFLKEVEKWREMLAKNIALRNKSLSIDDLNYSIQKIIDRIIFLIICEYKGIEPFNTLKNTLSKDKIYREIYSLFYKADLKYNSGLFDFQKDRITASLIIDNKVLKEIIKNLYYPESPYDFSLMSIEILGNVYEKFLGKAIRLTPAHQVKIEDKPSVKKQGGIYYTPDIIVDYIVEQVVGETIKNKTPNEIIEKIKIIDIACGSGTFLVRAYTYLLENILNWYVDNDPLKYKKFVYQYRNNQYRLTTEIKKKILIQCILWS